MKAKRKKSETINISREKILLLVSRIFGGTGDNPNPDEPYKPGPWDPVIRKVSAQITRFGPGPQPWIFGPSPDPWRSEINQHRAILKFIAALHPEIYDVIGGENIFGRAVSDLNPQPLPPRAAFIAAFTQEVIDRILLTQEIANALGQSGDRQGIIIVGGRLSMLVDELCGNNFKVKIPPPRPKNDTDKLLSALELLTAAAVIGQNTVTVADENLRQELENAGAKLVENGLARI